MADEGSPPSEDELIAFASELLGGKDFVDGELLRESIREARDLWLLLYQVHRDAGPQQ